MPLYFMNGERGRVRLMLQRKWLTAIAVNHLSCTFAETSKQMKLQQQLQEKKKG